MGLSLATSAGVVGRKVAEYALFQQEKVKFEVTLRASGRGF